MHDDISGYSDDYQCKWPFCLLYSYKYAGFPSCNRLSSFKEVLQKCSCPTLLYPTILLALCAMHLKYEVSPRGVDCPHPGPPLFFCTDYEEDTVITKNCALHRAAKFIRKKNCGRGTSLSFPVSLHSTHSAENHFFLES